MMKAPALSFLERPPKKHQRKVPALFLIHGYGANEADLFGFSQYLPDEFHIFSLNAPLSLPMGGFALYAIDFDAEQNKIEDLQQACISLKLIEHFIDSATEKYPIDKENINLMGFSQGAILSYALGLNTSKIKTVLVLSGYLNDALLTKPTHTKTKFFISHGTADPIIPFEWAVKAPTVLQNLNINYVFKSYSMGHEIAPENFQDIQEFIIKNI